MGWLAALKKRAKLLKADTLALLLALRHPATPWYAKAWLALTVAYALSPIDLIPDFIPILGLLDDIILHPLAISLAVKMIPPPVLAECRERARHITARATRIGFIAAACFVALWIALAVILTWAIAGFATIL